MGALYLLVGLFLALRPPRSKTLMAWGGAYSLTGGVIIYNNWVHLVSPDDEPSAQWEIAVLMADVARMALLLGLAGFVWRRLPNASRLASSAVLLIGCVVVAAWTAAVGLAPPPGPAWGRALWVASGASVPVAALIAGVLWVTLLEALRTRTMTQARTWLLVAFPLVGGLVANEFALELDFVFPDLVVYASDLPPRVGLDVLLSLLPAIPLAWCFALLGGPHARLVRNLLLALFAWVAVALLYTTTAPEYRGFLGMLPGPVRVLALSTVAYAILAGGFLPTPLRRPTARRGALAGIALASLIIGAQVAQNFLGDQYGTYVGGAVAGVVLVVAFPLQRRLEQAAADRGPSGAGSEEAFRRAASLALRDHQLSKQEELDLLDLAFRLRIPPGRAAALIDGERGSAAGPGATSAAGMRPEA